MAKKTSKKKFELGDYVAVLGLDHTFGVITSAEWDDANKDWLYRVDVPGSPMLVAEDSLERVEKFYVGDVVDENGDIGTVRDTDYAEGTYVVDTGVGTPQWTDGKDLKLVRKAGEVVSYLDCRKARPKARGSKRYWIAWYDTPSDSDYEVYDYDKLDFAVEEVKEYSRLDEILHDEYGLALVYVADAEWELKGAPGEYWSFWDYKRDDCKVVPLPKSKKSKKSNPESDAGSTTKRMMNPKNY